MHFITGNNGQYNIFSSTERDNIYFTATTNYYGLKLENLDTKVNKTLLVDDISFASDAYNKFAITVSGSSENLSNAVVDLKVGTHQYWIYPATGSTLISIDTTRLLGRGFLEVTGSTTTINTYTAADQDEVKVYGL
jgi:hypothetical protein